MHKKKSEYIQTVLRSFGFKATPSRLAIARIFSATHAPLNADMVCKALKKARQVKHTNEVTVYRTLASFAEKGILKRVDLRKDAVYFELNTEHHHHIVCTNCNMIEDFENHAIEKILRHIAARSARFINITEHSLELFGLCRACA